MRISDWSSDVCSSDLTQVPGLDASAEAQPPTTSPIVNAINNAQAAGAVIFFAMATTRGYSEDCFSNDISSLPNVIGVSASNNADTRTPAGYGDCMDVLAPKIGREHV